VVVVAAVVAMATVEVVMGCLAATDQAVEREVELANPVGLV